MSKKSAPYNILTDFSSRALTLEELVSAVNTRRAAGHRAVLSNGNFDLLHVGHIRSLQGARQTAEYLVVCINDDASVRRSKGQDRPIYPDTERAEMLLALEAVDYVHIFSENTVDHILRVVKPEYYAKGTDYTPDTIPETPTVLAYGGEIVIVGDPKDHATSRTLSRIQQREE